MQHQPQAINRSSNGRNIRQRTKNHSGEPCILAKRRGAGSRCLAFLNFGTILFLLLLTNVIFYLSDSEAYHVHVRKEHNAQPFLSKVNTYVLAFFPFCFLPLMCLAHPLKSWRVCPILYCHPSKELVLLFSLPNIYYLFIKNSSNEPAQFKLEKFVDYLEK